MKNRSFKTTRTQADREWLISRIVMALSLLIALVCVLLYGDVLDRLLEQSACIELLHTEWMHTLSQVGEVLTLGGLIYQVAHYAVLYTRRTIFLIKLLIP